MNQTEEEIKQVAGKIQAILVEHNMAMQSVIQIQKIPSSPIVAAGNGTEIPPEVLKEILEKQGDTVKE